MQLYDLNVQRAGRASLLPESDATLVCRARQDTHAFAPLYERYQDDVLRYTLRCLGNHEDAADATQQIFTNALAGLCRFQETGDSFKCWLFRIARNEVIDRQRQRARRPEFALYEADLLMDGGRSPEEHAILSDERALAETMVQRLPPGQRRCCTLRFAGLSHRETAHLLGKSEDAVRASYCRGVATLRELMDGAEYANIRLEAFAE